MIIKKRDVNGFKGSWEGITTSTVPFQTVIVGTVCLVDITKTASDAMDGSNIATADRTRAQGRFPKNSFFGNRPFYFSQ